MDYTKHAEEVENESEDNANVVLCVGLVVIDIVTVVDSFPEEDTKSRCDKIEEQVGGNAATNCRILSILGEKSAFMGCVGTTAHHLEVVEDFFHNYNIDCSPMVVWKNHPMPVSICILTKSAGTRTCLHYRGSIPELFYDDFINTDLKLSTYKWIHFEGRYEYHDTIKQIQYLHNLKQKKGYRYKISVELEKANDALKPLLNSDADYIFVSKDFSQFCGYSNKEAAAAGLSSELRPGVTIICPWGSDGAAAKTNDASEVVTCPAFSPPTVINTLGAGDTFIAACIKSLSSSSDLSTAVTFACKVAGIKCGVHDIDELSSMKLE